jgi:hypothetical protein
MYHEERYLCHNAHLLSVGSNQTIAPALRYTVSWSIPVPSLHFFFVLLLLSVIPCFCMPPHPTVTHPLSFITLNVAGHLGNTCLPNVARYSDQR